MDVKDYSQKLDQARDKYRQAQNDLRSSYEKNTEDIKETADTRAAKQSKNYDLQKSKLEEENLINNQHYSDKTKEVIADRQERFRNDIKKNSEKFDQDRNQMKSEFHDKLSGLSESYKKSTEENDRFHDQAKQTMADRYTRANKNYKNDFDKQIENLDGRSKSQFQAYKEDSKNERMTQEQKNQENLENLRSSGNEQKFKEVSRLRNDNENLRTNFEDEREIMKEQKEAQIKDVLDLKSKESKISQQNFEDLQQNIREKNSADQDRIKHEHLRESKASEKKFSDDLKSVKNIADQKVKGSGVVSSLKDENKQLVKGYEDRLQAARDDLKKNSAASVEKEEDIDNTYRDKMKWLKTDSRQSLDKQEEDLNNFHKNSLEELKDKNKEAMDSYKKDFISANEESENKLSKSEGRSKNQLQNQRVEFGKFINNVNDKKLEEISSIKSVYSKDKTNFIEKTRKDFSEEKVSMKDEFNQKLAMKDDLYQRKLADMENQTNKIIENYENRLGQIARKAEKEVDTLKSTEEERKVKEGQAIKIAFDNQEKDHQMEVVNLRDKYERMIGKDRILGEQQTNRIIQKYEDQIDRERTDHQRELSLKVSESQAQFERLFKASELEKETLRNQYEQRMENMRLASMETQGNTKKV